MSDETSNFLESSKTDVSSSSGLNPIIQLRYVPVTKRWYFATIVQLFDMLPVLSCAELMHNLLGCGMPEIEPSGCTWVSAAIAGAYNFSVAGGHLYKIECIRDAAKATCHLLVHWTRILLFFAAIGALSYYGSDFSHIWLFRLYIIGAGLIGTERVVNACVYRAGVRRGLCRKKVTIIGSVPIAATLVSQVQAKTGVRIVGAWEAKTLESYPSAEAEAGLL